MSASDQLTKLAARAKEAEDHGAAAQAKAKADLEQDVETARASAQAQAEKLREKADASKGDISDWWSDVQSNWNQHIAVVHANIESKRAEHRARAGFLSTGGSFQSRWVRMCSGQASGMFRLSASRRR